MVGRGGRRSVVGVFGRRSSVVVGRRSSSSWSRRALFTCQEALLVGRVVGCCFRLASVGRDGVRGEGFFGV